jgi:hypothetical protein
MRQETNSRCVGAWLLSLTDGTRNGAGTLSANLHKRLDISPIAIYLWGNASFDKVLVS